MPASTYGINQRSRGLQQSRQSPARSRRVTASAGLDADEDAEGEDDVDMEEGGDADDKEVYCTCQRMSYGEVRTGRTALNRNRAYDFISLGFVPIC